MGSIRLIYDAEGDILDVDFRLTGEKPLQGIELHDNVTLWTKAEGNIPLRLMLLSYSKLLEQPGLLFRNLKKLPSQKRASLFFSRLSLYRLRLSLIFLIQHHLFSLTQFSGLTSMTSDGHKQVWPPVAACK